MAGTRFLIQLSFLLELIVLSLLTLYATWTYNNETNQGLFPNRSGVSKLQQQILNTTKKSSLIVKLFTFELYIPSKVDREELGNILKLSLKDSREEFVLLEPLVETYESKFDDVTTATICEVKTNQDLLLLLETTQMFAGEGVTKVIMLPCVMKDNFSSTNISKQPFQSMIDVHESGGILVRIFKSRDDEVIPLGHLQDLLKDPISNIIADINFQNFLGSKYLYQDAMIKSTQVKLSVTVIDEDPLSYNRTHPHHHHIHLGKMLSNSLQLYLQPFLNALSPLMNITIHSKTTIKKSDNIIPLKLNNYSTIPKKSIESLFHDKSYMHSKYLDSLSPSDYSMEYIILLPSLSNAPLFITESSNNNQINDYNEVIRYQNGNIFTICNLPLSCKDCPTSILLQKQLKQIMTLFISQIRSQLLGLSKKRQQSNSTKYTISYLPIKNGIASYEADSLLQSILPIKYDQALEKLQILQELIHIRTNIPMNTEIGLKFQNVMTILHSIPSSNLNPTATLNQLNYILYTFSWLKHHPSLLELNHFPRDYWLAVFAPLLFPLIVPLIIGLGKEWKRLQKKRKEKVD